MNNLLNFKSFFRFLGKNKSYTFINVFGLSVSLMFVILIAVYTTQELSTDAFQEKADRIYLLTNTGGEGGKSSFNTAYRIADRISERYPEIEKVCPMSSHFRKRLVIIDNIKFNADLLFADTTFFEIFSFPLVRGEASQVLGSKYNAVISETFAQKAFSGADPVGQRIDMGDSLIVTVSGVMKDIKNSTIPTSDIIVRMDNVGLYMPSMDRQNYGNAGNTVIFILAKEGADLQARADDMTTYFKEIFWLYFLDIYTQVDFVPLREVYFSGISANWLVNESDKSFVLILLLVGILILLFAVINYINLTVAQMGFRAKEMATRRLLGSARRELFLRLILESTLLSLISFGIGLFLAITFASYAGVLLEKPLDMVGFLSPVTILACLVVIAVLGIVSGLLPATLISNAKPVDVVKGSFRTKSKMTFSKVFITLQNCITIALIAASLTMVLQVNHLINAPLGYRTENIIDIPVDNLENKLLLQTLTNELSSHVTVSRTSFCQGTPFSKGNNMTVVYEGRTISTQVLRADSNYFDMLGLQILINKGLEQGKGTFFNQYTFKEFQVSEDAQYILIDEAEVPIAGIVKDFQLQNITAKQQPVQLQISKLNDEDFAPWNLLVEIQGNPTVAYQDVKEVYERVTHSEFNGEFIDQQVAETYAAQKRMSKIVSIFCGIAILISLLGLIAMSTYFIRQRSHEIALRKVFGSFAPEILRKLVVNFLNYVLIAFVIATPIAWYILKHWLDDYSYRISLSPLIFIISGLFCLLISFITVFWQSYQAANSNPVKSLKSE
jgi:putative ABC transport system permease protein